MYNMNTFFICVYLCNGIVYLCNGIAIYHAFATSDPRITGCIIKRKEAKKDYKDTIFQFNYLSSKENINVKLPNIEIRSESVEQLNTRGIRNFLTVLIFMRTVLCSLVFRIEKIGYSLSMQEENKAKKVVNLKFYLRIKVISQNTFRNSFFKNNNIIYFSTYSFASAFHIN